MKEDTRTNGKLGPGELGSLMEKPQHQGSSVCLFRTVEQGGKVIAYSESRGQGLWGTA